MFTVYDSFGKHVEETNDLEHAKQRARTNDGWVVDSTGATVFDADAEED